MDDLMDRKSEELDRLAEATAAGYAIAMSDKARAAWQARRRSSASEGDPAAAAAQQRAAIARLKGYAWRGRNPIKLQPN